MTCASCHEDVHASAVVQRYASDPGVPICARCEDRLRDSGVLTLDANPYVLPKPGESVEEVGARVTVEEMMTRLTAAVRGNWRMDSHLLRASLDFAFYSGIGLGLIAGLLIMAAIFLWRRA